MNNLYQAGQEGSWPGVCEVIDDKHFIHHVAWPKRETRVSTFLQRDDDPLGSLLRGGWWKPYISADLTVPEGL